MSKQLQKSLQFLVYIQVVLKHFKIASSNVKTQISNYFKKINILIDQDIKYLK